jgi:hypothetical protein
VQLNYHDNAHHRRALLTGSGQAALASGSV